MGWFRRRPPSGNEGLAEETRSRLFRQYQAETDDQMRQDQDRLERGELPVGSEQRIARTVGGGLPWMSSLSVPGWAAATTIHAIPLVQVTGSAYYHAATDTGNRVFLDDQMNASNLIRAYYKAKELAMSRLVQEASMAGAHMVLDARHKFSREESTVIFSIIGTAVRLDAVKRPTTPLVSPLGGDDVLKLLSRGYLPVGYALGYHWHCLPIGYRTRMELSSLWNQEVTQLSRRFMQTRDQAIAQMKQDARRQHAVSGLVGAKITTRIEETELRFRGGFGGVTIDDMYYPYSPDGSLEVPAVNVEFFATAASIARISQGPASRDAIGGYLAMQG